jgi:Tfp pilus assembly protein PilO
VKVPGAKRSTLVAALVGVALIVLVVAGLILPKAAVVRSKQHEIQQAKQQESGLQLTLQQLQADATQAKQSQSELRNFNAKIPPTTDLPGLIRMLNTVAGDSDVDFMSLAPSQPTLSTDGRMSVIPTQIIVSGRYFAVDQFLYQLETSPRVSNVVSFQMSPQTQESPILQVVMTANFYTTDVSAGPGSVPGSTTSAPASTVPAGSSVPAPVPSAAPTPGA